MPDPDWKSKKILIVDNDAEFVSLAKSALQSVGVSEIQNVGSVPEAVKRIAEFPADLVIVEISLPRISGAQLAKVLRDKWRSPNPDVLIVMMVASAKADILKQACDVGVENFIRKPVTADAFLKRITGTVVRPSRFVSAGGYFGPDRRRAQSSEFGGVDRRKTKKPIETPKKAERENWDLVEDEEGDASAEDRTQRKVIPLVDSPGPASTAPSASRSPDIPLVDTPTPAAPGKAPTDNAEIPLTDAPAVPATKNSSADWAEAFAPEEEPDIPETTEPDAHISGVLEEHTTWLQSKGKEGTKAVFTGADLSGINLVGVNLANANLRESNLADSDCRGAVFQGSDMRHANLSGAHVGEADLAVAVMRHADLQLAQLQGANLRGTDLSGVNLKGASLSNADLSGATLLSTDLRETDLSSAIGLTQVQISRALIDSSTQLPPGLRRPQTD
jgi:CheY-like chemotaxis protein